MSFEVEQKYPVADRATIEAKLAELGARPHGAGRQVDCYYAHPARDFAQTDEALRIRRVGEQNFVTYKGPKLDPTTKTRRELELPIEPGDAGARRFAELLEALGFRVVREVSKRRSSLELGWEGAQVEVALDEVDGLGVFLELELIAEVDELDAAKARLASLAARLELGASERRGYLQMLLGE